MSEKSAKPDRGIEIEIDEQELIAPQPVMTGAELKTLGSVPAGYRLFLELRGDNDRLIADGDRVELKKHMEFYSLPLGTVGSLLSAQLDDQIRQVRTEFPGTTFDPASRHLRVPRVLLPAGNWNKPSIDLLIVVPPAYPQQAITGFETDADLRLRTGAQPAGTGFQMVGAKQYMHFCWNPQAPFTGAWRSLLEYVRFCQRRFADQTL